MILSAAWLAAAAASFMAAPAAADTGSFYLALEGGATAGRDNDVDEVVDPAGAEPAVLWRTDSSTLASATDSLSTAAADTAVHGSELSVTKIEHGRGNMSSVFATGLIGS
jgi:hypothetical protein